jgi:RNA ligase
MDKLDGSLGILYEEDGESFIATRGSFESEQAKWATGWWRLNVGKQSYGNKVTHLFEIIYPENRIVVNYDFEGLVYLGSIDNETNQAVYGFSFPNVSSVTEYPFTSVEELGKMNLVNKEGFVLHYQKNNLRVKIKFEEYVRLHKIVTGLSEKGLWEMLLEKGIDLSPEDVIKDVPDEFFAWLEFIMNNLKTEYQQIEAECRLISDFASIKQSRREQAEYILWASKTPGICFLMLDEKDYRKAIFQLIKPRGSCLFSK